MITSVLLKEMPFFQSFTMGEIDALLQNPDLVETYSRGEYIIVQGSDQTEDVFILVRGEVEITDAAHQHITYLASGSIFGEISFITHQPRTTNVVALGEVIVVRIDKKSVEKVDLKLQLRIKDGLIDTLISRLAEMNQKLVDKDRANQALVKALRERGWLEEAP
ncbi:MAG: cyclic nucleotide-binding domain-containing protein [Magnetococcales bacterium]|nr:cyclic nucleotide-binding domain-containing protein [Magnetococcales bacterium]MBF0149027.1 cyclic nucleotide-binding domain-containing protein [Magnetococcales bacterium]MBF0172076.1 cyclic nucleotide-binding domain-containing protein [Magnetococcales bacterium]MBF0346188.1 cyclic nucleotide-binding domain-containing protein [Magnetococcales bacterium]MBF0630319.1 cyclic nucleotide-binding domain-containing protein [Magnetococcales bacterium]